MKKLVIALGLVVGAVPAVLISQDQNVVTEGANEVVVTAQRREADDYSSDLPAIGLKRQADFAVIGVAVMGDSRDA